MLSRKNRNPFWSPLRSHVFTPLASCFSCDRSGEEEGEEESGVIMNRFSRNLTQKKSQGASQAMLYATGLTTEDMTKAQVRIYQQEGECLSQGVVNCDCFTFDRVPKIVANSATIHARVGEPSVGTHPAGWPVDAVGRWY